MIWTNRYDLPPTLVSAIVNDPYKKNREEALLRIALEDYGIEPRRILSGEIPNISVTNAIKPVRMAVLERRYDARVTQDVADALYRLLGQGVHEALARDTSPDCLKEPVLVVYRNGVLIHGEPDVIWNNGIIDDYKVIAVHALQRGIKSEWEQQMNFYAALLRIKIAEGKPFPEPRILRIVPILRDWLKSHTVKNDYPPAMSQVLEDVPVWSEEEALRRLDSRVRAHLIGDTLKDEELPECTNEEAYIKPEVWAIKREGNAKASKVVRIPGIEGRVEAEMEAEARNKLLTKGEKPYIVEHRPGEATRCINFCLAAPFCQQFQAYKAVAWRVSGKKEAVVEPI